MSACLAITAAVLLPQAGRVRATPQCPKAPDGFVVDLVMEHPEVKWPSAVHCREDGALLVAEDPMDMPGPTDQPLDRIWLLRFASDGSFTKTLFAERLFAVMGLQEIDDAIYVMNMPHLTVLRDKDGDGVAEERTELLTNLGPPAPGWPGGFNDHIVTGLRLGMDGFLYVSVGDKGVPRATGSDGREITLRGGGVVRVRPDGSQLEVVASGTRNHLDVAMNELDQIFTYDNTDDGLGWWSRLTHVMPTGYYGYPWDYHDHPERMLPCMKDDGGGSPVGGLCYREDAWPAPYAGSFYWCEWADRVIRRFELARDGASYRCTLTEDFVTPGESGEFRPLDLCESPDGRYLYVADWNFPGWTNPTEAGRVWRIRRADDCPGEPPRGGLPDMTTATLAKASVESLLANLDHPGFRRRLAAQRELARRRAFDAVGNLASNDERSDRARRHALWAIDSCSERDRGFVAALLLESSPDVRAQAARAIGERRTLPHQLGGEISRDHFFEKLGVMVATDPDLMVRREAAIALGRLGDGAALWPLLQALEKTDDLFVRFAVRQAIRALPCDWKLLLQKLLPMLSPRAQEDVWLALRELYDPELVFELARAATNAFFTPAQRARALVVLAEAHRQREPWDGRWWSIQPAKSGWPSKSVEWKGTATVVTTIEEAFASKEPELRAAALAAVRATREPHLFPCVLAQLDAAVDPAARAELIGIASELGIAEAASQFRMALVHADPRVRAAGVAALAKLLGKEANDAITPRLRDESPEVRAAALAALAREPDLALLRDYVGGLSLGEATRALCRSAIVALHGAAKPELEAMATRGELAPEALAVVREIFEEPVALRNFRLFGPFPRASHDAALESFDLAAAPAAPAATVEGALPHGFVDLLAALGDRDDVSAYALADFESPVAREARAALGSDDGATVWVNGALVFDHPGDRGWAPDQDRFALPLRAGPNSILVRIEQGGGDWSFNLKLSDVPSGPLFESKEAPAAEPFDLEKWRAFALSNRGDAARGKELFHRESGPGCFRCHASGGAGPKIGPDLSDVGTKYARDEILRSILEPSQRIQEGWHATLLFLKDGDVLSGLVTAEKDGVLSLADGDGRSREIHLSDVKERRASKLSAMPAGLAERLSRQELADLVTWLESSKSQRP
jgi:putative membrane-bound dehydrogenase-like protein